MVNITSGFFAGLEIKLSQGWCLWIKIRIPMSLILMKSI